MPRGQASAEAETNSTKREATFDAFRRWGYLQADLDPLGDLQPVAMPELEITGKDATAARAFYCGTIGAEFMHIPDADRRRWIAQRMESEAPAPDREYILERLVRADIFEQVLQTRYLGTKRYSLEGDSALIPLLDSILEAGSSLGAEQGVVAMSHRGRLNVMVHTIGRAAAEVFARFEDVDPRSVLGGGDVKYHLGATGEFLTPAGRRIAMHLVSNPSHLEAVDPVATGRARAKQTRIGAEGRRRVLPILLHGDAAFAGQGILAETLNMAGVDGFTVGGAIHIIVNNLIGFTTVPSESHSSRFSSDLSKRLPIPIFHVNAEDPDAVVRVGRIAADYRYEFSSPVVIDLIGYRKHGHSEVDDPTITQPLRYRKIQAHAPLWQIYSQKIGVDAAPMAARVHEDLDAAQKAAEELEKNPPMRELPPYWNAYQGGRYKPALEVETAVDANELAAVTDALTSYPSGFHIHPKVKKLLEQRAEMGHGK
ncbi:MAG: thiamine pyrophosphate-dependent enzyme, partial [Candidatus Acidiferrales bacterium]